jgi:hypothetical protein
MRHIILPLVLSFSVAGLAATGGDNAPEPVNVVVEDGRDVGRCADGGSLQYPAAPYKGTAFFLARGDRRFAQAHASVTKGQAPWLLRLDGPSSANRMYRGPSSSDVIVYGVCKPAACSTSSAYGAFDPGTGTYAIDVTDAGSHSLLGAESAELKAAIRCAREFDDKIRSDAARAIEATRGR